MDKELGAGMCAAKEVKMRKIITVLVVLTGVLLYRIYKTGESIVLEQDTDRIGQRRQDNGNMD
jgi:hypothetical protein